MPTHHNLKLYEKTVLQRKQVYNGLPEEIIGIGKEIKENFYTRSILLRNIFTI